MPLSRPEPGKLRFFSRDRRDVGIRPAAAQYRACRAYPASLLDHRISQPYPVLNHRKRGRGLPMLKASVFIVGNDATPLRLQSEMIRGWQVATATSREARQAIPVLAYDLLIVSRTVSEDDAHSLVARARKIQRPPKILVIRREHREWIVGSALLYGYLITFV
jgi:hypothetical protein